MKKKLDSSSAMGRIIFQMKDISVRMKPDVRAIVVRVYNLIDANPEDQQLRFRLRDDLAKLRREPQLSSLARMLFKELPNT